MRSRRRMAGLCGLIGVVVLGVACTAPTTPPTSTTTSTSTTSTTSTSTTSTSTTTTQPPDTSSLTPNPVPVDAGATSEEFPTISVHYAGLTPGTSVFIEQCRSIQTSIHVDCSYFDPLTIGPDDNTTGSGTLDFSVFRGAEPDDDAWGCYAAGDTPQDGIEFDTTCYVRITDVDDGNIAAQQLLPFTFAAS